MSKGKLFVTGGVGEDRPGWETAMRSLLLVLPLLLGQAPVARAQVSVGIGVETPGVSIGINLPAYPELQRVPGYPVYYAPHAPGNYFYYDGLYWVFQDDVWYASSWYNGPWRRVMPLYVPEYVLRVPVHYYRQPPPYFRHWRSDAPPRWDRHWGREWQQRRPGWDHRDRHAAPPPAPLPTYQRRYPQSRYPQEPARQQAMRAESFEYRPREPVSREAYPLPDRSPPHRRPEQQTQARPAPVQASRSTPPAQLRPPAHAEQHSRHQDRPPVAYTAPPRERGHPQGRAEWSNPRRHGKGDDAQVRPVQQTQPRGGSAQAAGPSSGPTRFSAPADSDRKDIPTRHGLAMPRDRPGSDPARARGSSAP